VIVRVAQPQSLVPQHVQTGFDKRAVHRGEGLSERPREDVTLKKTRYFDISFLQMSDEILDKL